MKPDLARKNLLAEDSVAVVTVTEVGVAVVAGNGQSCRLLFRTRLARNRGSSTCGLADEPRESDPLRRK